MAVTLNREILNIYAIPWTVLFSLTALFERAQRTNFNIIVKNSRFTFRRSSNFQRDLLNSLSHIQIFWLTLTVDLLT